LKRKRYGQKRKKKKKKKKKPIRKARPAQQCLIHAKGCRATLLIYTYPDYTSVGQFLNGTQFSAPFSQSELRIDGHHYM
jgi:hypothetical protein